MDMAWVKDIWHRCCFMYIYMYEYVKKMYAYKYTLGAPGEDF